MRPVFHNMTGAHIFDSYGWAVPAGRSRVRTPPCRCKVPCKRFKCAGCKNYRPWCCGASDDPRCDYCVTGSDPLLETS